MNIVLSYWTLTWLRQARLPLESEKFLAQQVDQFGDDPGVLELDAVDQTTGYLGDLGVPDGHQGGRPRHLHQPTLEKAIRK